MSDHMRSPPPPFWLQDIEQDDLLWGEELEYGIFKVRVSPICAEFGYRDG